MSRIAKAFAAGRKALIPYITAGDPNPGLTVELMHALVDGGADIIELGVPFSDPMADGPVIQRAAERALVHKVRLLDVLAMVRQFRERNADTPVVLMGYANPIERLGLTVFAAEAKAAGVDGVLVVDYPPEEALAFAAAMKAQALDPIFLLAPTSSDARIEQVGRLASGYVYYVSLRGVTGAAHLDAGAVAEVFPRLRQHLPQLPIGVGFGIRDAASAQAVARVADAVVIGSALVQLVERAGPGNAVTELRDFLRAIRQALDEENPA